MTLEERFEVWFDNGKYWFRMSKAPLVDAHKFCQCLMKEAYLAGRNELEAENKRLRAAIETHRYGNPDRPLTKEDIELYKVL